STPEMDTANKLREVPSQNILTDPLGRIAPEFHIPKGMDQRVAFWFDIYTKHDGFTHVIHHVRYPWIIYEVIDTKPMIENSKGPLWLRRQRADRHVKAERIRIQKTLRKLASRKSYKGLKGDEKKFYNLLSSIKGSRKSVFRTAKDNVRSQLGQKDFFVSGLRNSSKYLPYMEEEFTDLGVPIELTRMPFVESSFNEKAVSKVGASGIWQIMPRTGKAYMKVSKTVDERNSPLKSTRTAGKLLRQYYKALKSWPLAVTAYNHGIGNIKKAIRAARSEDLPTIISKYHRGDFQFASSNFYACVLASLHAEKYHDVLFPYVSRERLLEREVVTLSATYRFNTLKKLLKLSTDDMVAYNQDLHVGAKHNPLLPKGFRLHLPPGISEPLVMRVGTRQKSLERQAREEKDSQKSI
ncbi:MAG: lytic transglycosylase domain-containing protein, partial [Bdellovibrionales bacterium]|nr:lytic transglycosylase domain-containing protein [Bdellovibrionales bacterium]